MFTKTNLSGEAQSLSQIPLFQQLSATELEQLAESVEQVQVVPEQVIFHAHDQGDALYVVESGAVRVWVHDNDAQPTTLAELGPGEFFGELAVLDQGERSANASAVVPTTLHRLHRDAFHRFIVEHPAMAVDLVKQVGGRLRQTNMLVAQRAARNVNDQMDESLTFGQRVADGVAAFGGSWAFIITYGTILVVWMAINVILLARFTSAGKDAQFDPFPFILLNLLLSMTAAMQAPVILMSQNRSGTRDRLAAEQDFRVNLKSEIMLNELTRKDAEREAQVQRLIRAGLLAAGSSKFERSRPN
jgi:CRP/FNR family cyclic AMP-dependent transcriptional regulator